MREDVENGGRMSTGKMPKVESKYNKETGRWQRQFAPIPATYDNILNSPIGTKLQNTKTGEIWENTQQAKDWIKQQIAKDTTTAAPAPAPAPTPDTSPRPTGTNGDMEARLTALEGQVAELMKRMGNRNFDAEAANQRFDMAGQAVDHWDQQIADIDAQIADCTNPMSPNYDKERAADLQKIKQQYTANKDVASRDQNKALKNAKDYSAQTGNWALAGSLPFDSMQNNF